MGRPNTSIGKSHPIHITPHETKAAELKDELKMRLESKREERVLAGRSAARSAGRSEDALELLTPRSPSRALLFFQSVGSAWSTCWRVLSVLLTLGGILGWLHAWWQGPGPPALERDTSRDGPQLSPRDAESASCGEGGRSGGRRAAAAKPVAGEAAHAGGAPPSSGKTGGGSNSRRSVVASAPAIISSRPTALAEGSAGGSAGGSRTGRSGAGAMPHATAVAITGRPPGWLTFDPALGVVLASEVFELRARAGLPDMREAFWDPNDDT
jgi:hypothetical protein